MREFTYNNSRKSMLPKDYTKSAKFIERNLAILTAYFASLGAFAIGSCIGWSSNAINILSPKTFKSKFDQEDYNMPTIDVSRIVAIFALGATLSPILVYKTWRFIGSKFFILTGSGFLLTSWILLAIYENFITMLCARLLAGVAVGCLHFIIPVYVEDISSPELRTTIDYVWHSFLAAGIFFQFVLVYLGSIQLINVVSGIIPIILFLGFIFLPESPRYLCMKGQTNAAKDALRKFREMGEEADLDIHIWCNKKFEDRSFRHMFKSASTMRRLLPTFSLIALDQMVGACVAFMYMSWLFQSAGGEYSPELTSIIVSGIFLLSISSLKFLRISIRDKKTLIVTGILMSIALLILGVYLHVRGSLRDFGNIDNYHDTPLICYGIFIFLYGIGLCRISTKYIRILTPKRRYFAVRSLCSTLSWLLVTISSRFYPEVIGSIGVGWMFWFMGMSCLLLTIFTVFLIPDLESLSTKYILDDDDQMQHECEQQS